jgi:hypothetical protein
MSNDTRPPQRIQLRRTKGWRKPEGAIVVARPSRWGNPFVVGAKYGPRGPMHYGRSDGIVRDRAHAVQLYRRWMFTQARSENMVPELAGHDLACWCPLEDAHGNRMPCHADVLLELANPGWSHADVLLELANGAG